jgi:cell wall-associated NlpC family hydrolase
MLSRKLFILLILLFATTGVYGAEGEPRPGAPIALPKGDSATRNVPPAAVPAAEADAMERATPEDVETREESQGADGVVIHALALIDTSYKRGGRAPPTGFDCSGLVRYVYLEASGIELPPTAREMSAVGHKVSRAALRPGDLVFYNTLKRAFSHVGIYLGSNRFIHAPSSGGAVRIDDMTTAYWAKRFSGARRIL